MQDRYTADVGDFGKYGLLRAITGMHPAGLPRLSLGVVWYLTDTVMEQGDPAGDGKHTVYATDPRQARRFRPCDPDLFEAMGAVIEDGDRRVAATRERDVLGPNATYYEDRIHTPRRDQPREERLAARAAWIDGAVRAVSGSDVVFLDPDNGIEAASVRPQHKKGPKYAYLEELTALAGGERSLVVYHHLSRNGSAAEQVQRTGARIRAHLDASYALDAVTYHRRTARTFFIATPPRSSLRGWTRFSRGRGPRTPRGTRFRRSGSDTPTSKQTISPRNRRAQQHGAAGHDR